jgi:hypothetical protein
VGGGGSSVPNPNGTAADGGATETGDVLMLVKAADGSLVPAWSSAARQEAAALGDLSHLHVGGGLEKIILDLERRVAVLEAAGGGGTPPPTPADIFMPVDNYGGGFVRARWIAGDYPTEDLLDGQPHRIGFELATVAGPGGALIADTDTLATGTFNGGLWFDAGGSLGKIIGSTGGDISRTALANYITTNAVLTAVYAATDPAHPTLTITKIETPPGP